MFRKVVIQIAMQDEAKPMINALGLAASQTVGINQYLGLNVYDKTSGENSIILVTHGKDPFHHVDRVGPEAAALVTAEIIRFFQPDLIINAGTAGALSNTEIGDIFIGTATQRHDVNIPIPGFAEFGTAASNTPLQVSLLQDVLQLKPGLVSTGASLDAPEAHLAKMRDSGAAIKDMEASAIAEVARLHFRPVIFIKSITDVLEKDANTPVDFMANLNKAVQSLTDKMAIIVPFVLGKTEAQLNFDFSHLRPAVINEICNKNFRSFVDKLSTIPAVGGSALMQTKNKEITGSLESLLFNLQRITEEPATDSIKVKKMLKEIYMKGNDKAAVQIGIIIEQLRTHNSRNVMEIEDTRSKIQSVTR